MQKSCMLPPKIIPHFEANSSVSSPTSKYDVCEDTRIIYTPLNLDTPLCCKSGNFLQTTQYGVCEDAKKCMLSPKIIPHFETNLGISLPTSKVIVLEDAKLLYAPHSN